MKKITTFFTLLAFLFNAAPCVAHVGEEDPVILYSDDEDEIFNRGSIVGIESDEMIRARNRIRNRNWALAITSTIVGAAAMAFIGVNHDGG